jgi:ribonuclease P protein subunit RPR2
MVRVARQRISDLFALADREVRGGDIEFANRYVELARRIGMRYNVRLSREYRDLYCRSCSAFWVEGRTVRTRLRSGRRVRTCLRCGRQRRIPTATGGPGASTLALSETRGVRRDEGALVQPVGADLDVADEETEDE